MSSQEENGYQLQNNQVNLKEMKEGVGLNFYIELNPAEQVNCERMEINVEGMALLWHHGRQNWKIFCFQQEKYFNCNPSLPLL